MTDPYGNGAEDYADFLENNPRYTEVKLTASLIVQRYLEKLRSHPGFPERRYPPEYYADELVEEIATALTLVQQRGLAALYRAQWEGEP
jgi:hypothetical protein